MIGPSFFDLKPRKQDNMRYTTIAIIAAASQILGGCQNANTGKEADTTQKVDPAVQEFIADSNGNWQNTDNGIHAYISAGAITISKIEGEESTGMIAGYYNQAMKPDTREAIDISEASGTLSETKVANLISRGDQISIQIGDQTYPLSKEAAVPKGKAQLEAASQEGQTQAKE